MISAKTEFKTFFFERIENFLKFIFGILKDFKEMIILNLNSNLKRSVKIFSTYVPNYYGPETQRINS